MFLLLYEKVLKASLSVPIEYPALVRTELEHLIDTGWLGLNKSRNRCSISLYLYRYNGR